MSVKIRPARPGDAQALREIERRAGDRFREVGLAEVADNEPTSLDVLARYAEEDRSWVAAGADGDPVGYVLVEVVDGCAHIEQVSVRPDHQGRGVGRALVELVKVWAAAVDMPAITLTTFRHVEWNAPLYRRLGFRELTDEELGPELRAVRDHESAQGLDPASRVCMRLDLLS